MQELSYLPLEKPLTQMECLAPVQECRLGTVFTTHRMLQSLQAEAVRCGRACSRSTHLAASRAQDLVPQSILTVILH